MAVTRFSFGKRAHMKRAGVGTYMASSPPPPLLPFGLSIGPPRKGGRKGAGGAWLPQWGAQTSGISPHLNGGVWETSRALLQRLRPRGGGGGRQAVHLGSPGAGGGGVACLPTWGGHGWAAQSVFQRPAPAQFVL